MPDKERDEPSVRRLQGDHISLRRFRLSDEREVWEARQASIPRVLPGGAGRRRRLHQRILASGRFLRGSLDLAIEAGNTLIGDVQARQGVGQHLPPGVVELGIQIYDPEQRRKRYGAEAIALLTEWIFGEGIAERVQASTSVDNVGMRRVLEKLGFCFEGVMRGFMPVDDHREDFALYGVTREEWLRNH